MEAGRLTELGLAVDLELKLGLTFIVVPIIDVKKLI